MKTAVEWLYEELKENNLHTFNEWKEIFKQAKEMEKQQIMDAVLEYRAIGICTKEEAEQYYNETFKN